jgi:hypothetical protein
VRVCERPRETETQTERARETETGRARECVWRELGESAHKGIGPDLSLAILVGLGF